MENNREAWVVLRSGRALQKLMILQNVSHRQLAAAAGWRSHSYVGRLINGSAKSVEVASAVRIAERLSVRVDDLFLVRASKISA